MSFVLDTISPSACSGQHEQEILFEPELLKRFDVNGPRYTSYPSADRFHEGYTASNYDHALKALATKTDPVSLYFHIPFCPNICYYCACNKIITKDHSKSQRYIEYLAKEMDLVLAALGGRKLSVSQMHWGGGTPTFLSHQETRELMGFIHNHFELLPDGEYSIEIDPRRVKEADIALLAALGFNRISLGVQDIDPTVQAAIHRIQSVEETQAVLDWSHLYGFKSRSIDLIYGLPKQSRSTFEKTVAAVLAMQPDRISVYNYAHLPHAFKPQRRILETELPSANEKLAILANTISQLQNAGYVFIGMDHFAKPSDELAIAQREGRLHRNFQGYSTQAECDLIALGVSSIGKVAGTYTQNHKTLPEYYAQLDRGVLPTLRGITLNDDDRIRRDLIGELMCQFELDTKAFAKKHAIDFADYFAVELAELANLEGTGLIENQGGYLRVPMRGRLLARRVAMVFDRHLRESRSQAKYSKVL